MCVFIIYIMCVFINIVIDSLRICSTTRILIRGESLKVRLLVLPMATSLQYDKRTPN